jgi:hypothetical protein
MKAVKFLVGLNKQPYSGLYIFMNIIEKIANIKVPAKCPISTRIVIDAGKQWASLCRDGAIFYSKETFIDDIKQYWGNLNRSLANDFTEIEDAKKYFIEYSGYENP